MYEAELSYYHIKALHFNINSLITVKTAWLTVHGLTHGKLTLTFKTVFSKAIYSKYFCQKKEKQQYIAVSTVRMFIEPSAKH